MINEVTFSFSKRHGERNRGNDAVGGEIPVEQRVKSARVHRDRSVVTRFL